VSALTNSAGQVVAYLANDPTARYIATGLSSFGNAGRNTLRINPIDDFDMALVKKFSIRESVNIQFGRPSISSTTPSLCPAS
jgi:hypothetical protein